MTASLTQLAAHYTAQTAALQKLYAGTVSPYLHAFKGTTNFAVGYEHGTEHNTPTGTDAQEIEFGFTGNLQGDIVIGAHLQVHLPQLKRDAAYSAMWVWGVGYAMVQSAELRIGGTLVERLHGDYMEMASELHGSAGSYMEGHTLKLDSVTVPDMARVSCEHSNTLYVPLPFFFARSPHCVLPIGRFFAQKAAGKQVSISVSLRSIADITVGLNQTSTTEPSSEPAVLAASTGTALTYNQIKVRMWLTTVLMSQQESSVFTANGYRAVCTTAFSYSTDASSRVQITGGARNFTNLPFRQPVKCLMWAVGDQQRTNTAPTSYTTVDPFDGDTAGVRKLNGARMSYGYTIGGPGSRWRTDWNTLRAGAVDIDTVVTTGTTTATVGIPLRSHSCPKVWRNDGLAGCAFLPGNRFDYRAHDGTSEVEPVRSVTLKLAGKQRWDDHLGTPSNNRASHFRIVQPMNHFNRIPRKGIYAYSFAKNASSAAPTGSINMHNISNRDLSITLNNSQSTADFIMYAEALNVFTMDFADQTFGMRFAY